MRFSSRSTVHALFALCAASACSANKGADGAANGGAGGISGAPAGTSNGDMNSAGGASGAAGTNSSAGGAAGQSTSGGNSNGGASEAGDAGGAAAGASSGGAAGLGGTAGAAGGSGLAGASGSSEPSGMPLPPSSGVAKPAGAPGNLSVLSWAGFKASVSFTFDDALSSQIANYAALQATGVHLTFYLVSNNNGSSAIWSQAAKDGHELGNHTAHHCHDDGTGCAWGTYAGSLGAELDQCTAHIEQQFGTSDVWSSASPYGDAGYQLPAGSRFLLNRGVQVGQIAPNDNTSPYALPCHTAAEGELASTFNSLTDSARSSGKWQIFLIHSLGGDGGYHPISIDDVSAAISHAKSAGDIWADDVVHVGAYWRAQKLISGLAPSKSGSTQTWSWTLPAHFPPGRYLRVKVDGGTLSQAGQTLTWSQHGYYEVSLDTATLTLSP